jgi:hypothetical protein
LKHFLKLLIKIILISAEGICKKVKNGSKTHPSGRTAMRRENVHLESCKKLSWWMLPKSREYETGISLIRIILDC